MPPPRRARRGGLLLPFVLLVSALGMAVAGPRMVRAHAALQWTRHHAAQAPDASGQHARSVARWAKQTLAEAAPHPWGADACQLALEFGGRQEASNPAAALALYETVRAALEAAAASRWRGLGVAVPLAQARQREQSLRQSRADDGGAAHP